MKNLLFGLIIFCSCSNNAQETKWVVPENCDTTGFHEYCDSLATAWRVDSLTNGQIDSLGFDWCKTHLR